MLENSRIKLTIARAGDGRGLFVTGGHLIDADVVRSAGEPGGDRFRELFPAIDFRVPLSERSWIEAEGAEGRAVVRVTGHDGYTETMKFLDILGRDILGLTVTTDYILKPGQPWVLIRTTVVNPTSDTMTGVLTGDFLAMGASEGLFTDRHGFGEVQPFDRVSIIANRNPAVSYALVAPGKDFSVPVAIEPGVGGMTLDHMVIPPGGAGVYERYLIVGRTLSAVIDEAQGLLGIDTVEVGGTVLDWSDAAVNEARIVLRNGDRVVSETLTTSDGQFRMRVPPGFYQLVASAPGTASVTLADLDARKDTRVRVDVTAAARLRLAFDGPVKITAVQLADGPTAANESTSVVRYSNDGRDEIPLTAGRWRVTASRGMDYELHTRELDLVPGAYTPFGGVMERAILGSRDGWLASDFHQHTVGSPDGEPTMREKLIQNIAEGCQVAVITDHDRVSDTAPHTDGLGAPLLAINGVEASPMPDGHINAFPIEPGAVPNGNRLWLKGGLAGLLDRFAQMGPDGPLVVVNHPRTPGMGLFQFLKSNPFSPQAPGAFDALEVNDKLGSLSDFLPESDAQLAKRALTGARVPVMLDWFGWLNHGQAKAAVGVSDSHKSRLGTCHARTYVFTGRPTALSTAQDVVRAVRGQRAVVSGGIFVDVKPFGLRQMGHQQAVAPRKGLVALHIRVEAPTWIRSDTVTVFSQGRPVAFIKTRRGWRQANLGEKGQYELPTQDDAGALRFDAVVNVRPKSDAWFVVVARGKGDGQPVFRGRPYGYTNPVYVDTDGDGVATITPPATTVARYP